MKLIIGKLYNKGMYLGNTEDLYIDGGELAGDHRNVFLKDDSIYDTWDNDILEDNSDMLPAKIVYNNKEYILNISSFELQSGYSVYELTYQGWRYIKTGTGGKIKTLQNFYENDGQSINELIKIFNEWKNNTNHPKEIRYIY